MLVSTREKKCHDNKYKHEERAEFNKHNHHRYLFFSWFCWIYTNNTSLLKSITTLRVNVQAWDTKFLIMQKQMISGKHDVK